MKIIISLCLVAVSLAAISSLRADTNALPLTGNVGIGTTSPSTTLDLVGPFTPAVAQLKIRASGTDDRAGLTFWNIGGSTRMGIIYVAADGDFLTGVDGPGRFRFFSNGTERMTIDGNGNVGIGTTNPVGKLQVSSSASGLQPMLYAGGALPQWPLALLAVSGSNSDNTTSAIIGLNLENTSAATGAFAPFITFSSKSNSALFSPTFAAIGAQNLGQGSNAHWVTGALTFLTAGSLVYDGPVERMRIDGSGNVGIGTTNPTHKLSVNGTIRAKEVIVDTGWSDYVFAPDYKLASLSEVETHIKQNGHLPGIPSAKEVAEHGVSMGEMQAKLLAKIEELTLHQIEQEKEIKNLKIKLVKFEQK